MKFISEEWFVEHEKLCRAEFSKPNNSNAELTEVYNNWDGDKTVWFYYKVENGLIAQIKRGEGADNIPPAMFRATGDCSSYVKVVKGELDPKKGIMTGKFKLDGNLMKAMGMLGIYARLTECKKVSGAEF